MCLIEFFNQLRRRLLFGNSHTKNLEGLVTMDRYLTVTFKNTFFTFIKRRIKIILNKSWKEGETTKKSSIYRMQTDFFLV